MRGTPIAQFQWTIAERDDTWRLVRDINRSLPAPHNEAVLEGHFKSGWTQFKRKLDRIAKESAVKALLVSVCLRSVPLGRFHIWTGNKQLPTSYVPAFRSNVIDFDVGLRCWAGSAFDYVHYHMPRESLDEIAEDWQYGPISEYRQAMIEDDLVLAQMTRNILPSITMEDEPCSLVLDQFQLVLGAHLIQRYGGIAKIERPAGCALATWQKQRALELLRDAFCRTLARHHRTRDQQSAGGGH